MIDRLRHLRRMNAIPGNEYTVQQWDAVIVRLPFHSLAVCVRVCLSIRLSVLYACLPTSVWVC